MTTYRDAPPARLYMCSACSSPEQVPAQSGSVVCSKCGVRSVLSDRSALLSETDPTVLPNNDPHWLARLRFQDGRALRPPSTLQTVLGGESVRPGREQEAIAVWQSLRARSAAGDASASEDMSILVVLLSQVPSLQDPKLQVAISESSFDASVLPRHRQQHLGRIARLAVAAGDRARAGRYLSWMTPNVPELEIDSEFRVTAAFVATMDDDHARVLSLLGPRKDVIPIADNLDPMASIVRANACEHMNDLAAARHVLTELPDPKILDLVRSRFPGLQLCAQSAEAYQTAVTQQAAERAAKGAGAIGRLLGGILAFTGVVLGGVGLAGTFGTTNGFVDSGGVVMIPLGGAMLVLGIVLVIRARASSKRAAWLRTHGLSLAARVVDARQTGTRINNVPLYEFVLEVAGPSGPYQTSFRELAAEHQVAILMGRELRVRADPNKLHEIVPEA